MNFIADLHIHSRYSRATSPDLGFEELHAFGKRKGVAVIGTGDCTHPAWLAEIGQKLVDDGSGLLSLKINCAAQAQTPVPALCAGREIRFIITGEISTIYKRDGAVRKVHHVVLLPSLDAAVQFSRRLEKIGNIASDGRPILGLDSRDLLEILLSVSPHALLIPAHIWTPWFSVLGSKSGFDSIDECYRDLTSHITAVETGLSSDPAMNWRLSSLDRFTLISNSDAHSAARLGREANLFSGDRTYAGIMNALARRSPGGFTGTIEFFPEEGKYHHDGHRACNIRFSPQESHAHNGLCPVCKKKLTFGVQNRVDQLADRAYGYKPVNAPVVKSAIGLAEILGELAGVGAGSKRVAAQYERLLGIYGSELDILLNVPLTEFDRFDGGLLAEALRRMRAQKVFTQSGYDGEYGSIKVFEAGELKGLQKKHSFHRSKNKEKYRLIA